MDSVLPPGTGPQLGPDAALATRLRSRIRTVPDHPKPGILFRDITPLLEDPGALGEAVEAMAGPFLSGATAAEAVAGIESRGFLFGTPVALRLGAAFLPLRKAGKLPKPVAAEPYSLEYGKASLEIRTASLVPGQRVLIIDDVLATGGTAAAAFRLLRRRGGAVVGFSFLLSLPDLGGEDRLAALGVPVHSLLRFP